ncbi:MAG: GGDEF domain-containing protein [Sulfuricella sp.]|nr:GGDEF domain-containing protein [Sulfuricella sp.]
MEPVELLKQNLAIEPDLQNFIGFVLESVNKLGGNPFASSIASLDLMQKLRNAGAATGFPLPACLLLQGHQLRVQWGEHAEHLKITNLAQPPKQDTVAQLRRHLQNSTASADPAILLQRNAEMARHLDETRARTEKELEALQQTLEKRQTELHESLRQAETDPLTGLLNRRAFDEKLGQAFRHTMRQKTAPLSLVLFDLDNFKGINDEFGHQFGDAYLNKMAHALCCAIRVDVDFAFRFGGDEFAMVIFADYPQACNKATQVLRLMETKVSIGISTINPNTPDSLTVEEFIHHADSALYEAKNSGRGRAVVDLCALPDSGNCQFPCPHTSPHELQLIADRSL